MSNKLRKEIFHPTTDRAQMMGRLKQKAESLKDFNRMLRHVQSHPYVKHLIDSPNFPQSFDSLRQTKPIPGTNNLVGEIAWALVPIIKYKAELKAYLTQKSLLERQIILGQYEAAKESLAIIETTISISVWSAEISLLIEELESGTESNWNRLSELSHEIKNALILFTFEHLSKRVESKISYFRFRELFGSQVSGINAQGLFEYLCFKIGYPAYEGFDKFSYFLALESNSALIDRYNTLIELLVEQAFSIEESTLQPFLEVIETLDIFHEDSRIGQLRTLLTGECSIRDNRADFMDVCDMYSEGRFQECITVSQQKIAENPTALEFYELHAKSLIQSRAQFNTTEISTLVDDILESIFELLSRGPRNQEAAENLFKYALMFQSSTFGRQILGLVNQHMETAFPAKRPSHIFIMNSQFSNPRILEFISSSHVKASQFISDLEAKFGASLSVNIISKISEGNTNYLIENEIIADSRKQIYIARAFGSLKQYKELIVHLEKLDESTLTNFDKEERCLLLFQSFLEIQDYRKALVLAVDIELNQSSFSSRIDEDKLFDLIHSVDNEGVEDLIELPVFYKQVGADAYAQYVAYDTFLNQNGFSKPTELEFNQDFEYSRLKYFLYEVCRPDVLQYSLEFEELEEVEKERQDILKMLIKEDREDEDLYVKEIAELAQSASVRDAIEAVSKGKITVNIPQLKDIELKNIREGFLRYKEISNYSRKNKDLVGIDVSVSSLTRYVQSILEEHQQNKEDLFDDPAYVSFKSLFLDLRDKFLLSKEYGLDGYLSTRIRHGTLENHIRSVFENANLVGEKDANGLYGNIQFWEGKLNPASNSTIVQDYLKGFSDVVDKTISYIKDELIQIYTARYQDKPNGLFNFNFTSEYLGVIFTHVQSNIKDHEDFIDYVFLELQDWLDYTLTEIRKQFNTQIKDRLIHELDELQQRVNEVLVTNQNTELNTSILNCRTEIQNELKRISEWFYLSNPSTNLILDAMTTLQTGVEITNSISPMHQIKPTYNCELDLSLQGANHVLYINRILLDNIIKHSGITDQQIEVDIGAELIEDKKLRLSFRNDLSPDIDKLELKEKLEAVSKNWHGDSSFEMSNKEGGSGFDKIRRILTFDLKKNLHDFNYCLTESDVKIMVDIGIKINDKEHGTG